MALAHTVSRETKQLARRQQFSDAHRLLESVGVGAVGPVADVYAWEDSVADTGDSLPKPAALAMVGLLWVASWLAVFAAVVFLRWLLS